MPKNSIFSIKMVLVGQNCQIWSNKWSKKHFGSKIVSANFAPCWALLAPKVIFSPLKIIFVKKSILSKKNWYLFFIFCHFMVMYWIFRTGSNERICCWVKILTHKGLAQKNKILDSIRYNIVNYITVGNIVIILWGIN